MATTDTSPAGVSRGEAGSRWKELIRRAPVRDGLLVAVVVVIGFLVAGRIDLLERIVAVTAARERFELDELLPALILLGLATTWYAVRRLRESRSTSRELRRTLDDLAAETAERRRTAERLEVALAEAKQASEAKSAFLAVMSHELRTPMNGVLGMLDLLSAADLDPREQRFVETAMHSGDLLLTLIDDLLDLSRIDARQFDHVEQDFSVRQLVDEMVEAFTHRVKAKGVDLTCDVDRDVPRLSRGDPMRLRQVLVNLMGNAVKYTDRGEIELRVRLEATHEQSVLLRFEVRDTGIGIAESDLDGIFDRFERGSGHEVRPRSGAGLGLAIAKGLVEVLGGHMSAQSDVGKGSIFAFSIPLREALAPSLPPKGDPLRGLRAIVVDRNEATRAALQEQILDWGMRNGSFARGDDALAHLREAAAGGEPYDVAVVDAEMADMTYVEFVQRVTEEPTLAGVRVVLLVGEAPSPESPAVLGNDLVRVLVKPVGASVLFDALVELAHQSDRSRPAATTAAAARELQRPLRLLMAEDNELNQEVVTEMLHVLGCEVDVVPDGKLALAALGRESYDAVLMDCRMPTMDGYEATRRLRAREAAAGQTPVPVIAMTAYALAADQEKCYAAGMSGYISKPFGLKTLQDALSRWVQPSSTTRAIERDDKSALAPGTDA